MYESNCNISGKLKLNIDQNLIKSIEFVSEYGTIMINNENLEEIINNHFKCVSNNEIFEKGGN
jgi:hypothetical protein